MGKKISAVAAGMVVLCTISLCLADDSDKQAGKEPPAGDRNPVGWRRDGTGQFPNATPPLTWGIDKGGNRKNIAWVSEMPGYSPSSVIVAGDRLFAGSNDYSPVCLDKKTGKILWVRSVSPYDAATKEERDANKDVFAKLDVLAELRDKLNGEIPAAAPDGVFAKGVAVEKVEQQMEKLLYPTDADKYANNGMGWSDGGYMAATPASDGACVYAWNGWGVTACFDMNGTRKWIRFDKVEKKWPLAIFRVV